MKDYNRYFQVKEYDESLGERVLFLVSKVCFYGYAIGVVLNVLLNS